MGHLKAGTKVYNVQHGEGEIVRVEKDTIWMSFWRIPNFINDGVIPASRSSIKKNVPTDWDSCDYAQRENISEQFFLEEFTLKFQTKAKKGEVLIEKGYRLEVESYEGDGDHSQTNSMTFETKEEAKKIYKMCKTLFVSNCNDDDGIGNLSEGDDSIVEENTLKYLEKNQIFENQDDMKDKDKASKVFHDYCVELIGYPFDENGLTRAFSSAKLFYCPEDVVSNVEKVRL